VIAALTKAAKPLSRPELITATRLTGPEIQRVLKRLTREKQVVQSGARRHFRWAIAPTPHTRAVAHAAGPEMEVVFDGSRGQSLSSYQQKPRG
jgi:DNA-binding IclR family transcriptional regulator